MSRGERSGGPSATGQFVLTVAGPAATAAVPARDGAAGASVPAPPQPTMYTLRAADEPPLELSRFVGHRVKVTGTSTGPMTTAPLAGRSAEATPYQAPVASPSEAGAGATGTPFDAANLPTLVVTTIASMSATCR